MFGDHLFSSRFNGKMYRIAAVVLSICLLFYINVSMYLLRHHPSVIPAGSTPERLPLERTQLVTNQRNDVKSDSTNHKIDGSNLHDDAIQNSLGQDRNIAGMAGTSVAKHEHRSNPVGDAADLDGTQYDSETIDNSDDPIDDPCPRMSGRFIRDQSAHLHGWKPVIRQQMFVYSAYVDPTRRATLTIHVVGFTDRHVLDSKGYKRVTCHLWRGGHRNTTARLVRIAAARAYLLGAIDKQWVTCNLSLVHLGLVHTVNFSWLFPWPVTTTGQITSRDVTHVTLGDEMSPVLCRYYNCIWCIMRV